MKTENIKDWIRKHPVLAGIIAFFAISLILGMFIPKSNNNLNKEIYDSANDLRTNEVYDPINDLEILDLSCKYGEYDWIYVKGRVKNNGDNTFKFVEVDIDLFNGDKWVESGFTFIRTTDLSPGETDSFEKTFGFDQDDKILFTRCEASLS